MDKRRGTRATGKKEGGGLALTVKGKGGVGGAPLVNKDGRMQAARGDIGASNTKGKCGSGGGPSSGALGRHGQGRCRSAREGWGPPEDAGACREEGARRPRRPRGGFACHGKRGGHGSPGWVVESPPLPSPPTSWLLSSPLVQREETETSLPLSKSAELNLGIAIAAFGSTSRIGKTTQRLRKSGSSAAVSAAGGRGSGQRGLPLTSAREGAGADRRGPYVSETRWRSTVDRDHKDGPPPVHGRPDNRRRRRRNAALAREVAGEEEKEEGGGSPRGAATEGAAAEGGGGAPRGEDDGGDSAVSNEGEGAAGVWGNAANAVEAVVWREVARNSGKRRPKAANAATSSASRWRWCCCGGTGKRSRGRGATRCGEADGGGGVAWWWLGRRWRAAGVGKVAVELGFTVESVPGWFIAEAERWTGCDKARRGRRCKRRGTGTAVAAAAAGWSPPASGGAWAHGEEGVPGMGELGREGKTEEGSTRVLYIGLRDGDRGRERWDRPVTWGGEVELVGRSNRRRFLRGEWGKRWRTWTGSCPRGWMRARVREGAGFCGDVGGNGGWGWPARGAASPQDPRAAGRQSPPHTRRGRLTSSSFHASKVVGNVATEQQQPSRLSCRSRRAPAALPRSCHPATLAVLPLPLSSRYPACPAAPAELPPPRRSRCSIALVELPPLCDPADCHVSATSMPHGKSTATSATYSYNMLGFYPFTTAGGPAAPGKSSRQSRRSTCVHLSLVEGVSVDVTRMAACGGGGGGGDTVAVPPQARANWIPEMENVAGSSTAGTKQAWRTGGCSRPPHAWVAHASHLAARLDMKQDSEAEVLRAVCAAALRPRGGGVAAVDSFPYRVARCR
uniref:Uncharacterized protein n=1 Tax=Oryza sativa subsp. japonica TaxID=39947 RepID=Q6Z892_ORYSJ|nr:hypothetical protein [Oryza sativa Japonica Group]BAD07907.1 hypothetical protein [Oryza sativa Japonica Group]